MKNLRKKAFLFFFAFLIFSNFLAILVIFDLNKNKFLKVVFFDVGQGDAIFIETPQRHQILIDGGPSSIILEKLAREMPFWDRTIDLVILTHPEKDHLIGLLEILKNYKVENILWTGIKRETSEFKEWEKQILKEGSNIKIAQAGQRIIANATNLIILFPLENLKDKELKDINDSSIVVQLVFYENSFLFTGDISQSVEKKLTTQYNNLLSDVLKISHHGSRNSNSDNFLEKVSPRIAVISVGKNNPYGHPHQEVLNFLEKYGIKIFRTDLNGDIAIISDGHKIKIK